MRASAIFARAQDAAEEAALGGQIANGAEARLPLIGGLIEEVIGGGVGGGLG